jgi:RHS repeat-associated protein
MADRISQQRWIRSGLLMLAFVLVSCSHAFGTYDPKHGRWLQRDPLGTNPSLAGGVLPIQQYLDGVNLYQYGKSNPVVMTDPMGGCSRSDPMNDPNKPPSLPGGVGGGAMNGAWELMAKKCDSCCSSGDVCRCKIEAKYIARGFARFINNNHGKGLYPRSRDAVGGYLCWDWAKGFHQSLRNGSPTKWSSEQVMLDNLADDYVHFFTRLWACGNRRDTCRVKFDDGFFSGGCWYHEHPGPTRHHLTEAAFLTPKPAREW